MLLDVVGCETGSARYPGVADRVRATGAQWSTVECFDRCEACERALLVKIDGTLMRFPHVDELVEAVSELGVE